MLPECSKSLTDLPPYLFVKLNALKEEAIRKGLDVIDLAMGNPDRPTPPHIVEALCKSVREHPATHRYPLNKGMPALRRAIADWFGRRFGVTLDPDTEVLPLLGSKEGLAHLFFAYLTPADTALIPSPCYPVHYNGTLLTGAKVHSMPLLEENGFLPDLDAIPAKVADKAKILLINYPNNPTGAVMPDNSLFERAIAFGKKHQCLIAHDNAYSEITFEDYSAPSFMQMPQAKKYGIEFHSFSKTYSMAGWRIAFAVGNPEVLANLAKFKSFLDYGIPGFIQEAAIEALNGPQDCAREICSMYRERRDALAAALRKAGWNVSTPRGAMYLWARLPEAFAEAGSFAFAEHLLLQEGVVVSPGIGFGPYGEGYVRFALVDEIPRMEEAARRIGRFLQSAPAAKKPSRKTGRTVLLTEH